MTDPDWRALLAALFKANSAPEESSFPNGDAGGTDSMWVECAFCGEGSWASDNIDVHDIDCPWEAAREALKGDQ